MADVNKFFTDNKFQIKDSQGDRKEIKEISPAGAGIKIFSVVHIPAPGAPYKANSDGVLIYTGKDK